jgi:hypothetical protein
MNIKKAAKTALEDIPIVSRSIQKTMAGKDTGRGPDLKHAREWNVTGKDKGYYSKPFSPDDAGTKQVNEKIRAQEEAKKKKLKQYQPGSATNANQAIKKVGLL